MEPHFPIELQRLVIAHLWEDDDTLAACSLVSSQWFELARTMHFSKFRLQLYLPYMSPKDSFKFQELKTLIQAPQSRLRPFIRQLEIRGTEGASLRLTSANEPRNLYGEFSSELLSLLPLLTCVTDLTLMAISWSQLLPDARHAIQSLSGVNSLACVLCSGSVDDLILISDCFPQLRTLRISHLRETTGGASPTLSQWPKALGRLRVLDLMDSERSTVPLLKPDFFLPLTKLTGLTLQNYDPSCWEAVSSILRVVGPILSDLTLGVQRGRNRILQTPQEIEPELPEFPISLASNVNMKTLTFVAPSDADMWWIELLFNTISDEHNLENIKFSISPFTKRPPVRMENIFLRVAKPTTRVIWQCYDQRFQPPATVTQAMPELTRRGQLWASYHTLPDPFEKIWNRVGHSTVAKRLCSEE
ncbi:hypothetical protein H0H93_004323 [Arthromyces matolae]|nr:hypothetical protein H0H93_004323 [Arthromyces matolae]